ncbi:kinase-like protein [Lojkania enalia]|uniref:Kinase-like protein n=1 Tax=Lojkania enalia TaxID=147567 RepID=A0A9P4N4J9_9PLEO|nr:kinase-like protein [Didymosphaeria enalia]
MSIPSPFSNAVAERLASFFDPSQPRETYRDAEIDEIAKLLKSYDTLGWRCPRTYIVLRSIGELGIMEQLTNEGFTDQWFPVQVHGLPNILSPSLKSRIVKAQNMILTKSLDLEHGRHRHFTPGEPLPFDIISRLGSGSYGQVDKIVSKVSFHQYALKRIRRRQAFGQDSKEAMERFKSEIDILKGLSHKHVVRYIGSYTDKSHLGIVMFPVAQFNLAAFMEQTCVRIQTASAASSLLSISQSRDQASAVEMRSMLRTSFGCLAAALAYLHDKYIRHKDIKPQNILVDKGNVFLTDFGLSRDLTDDIASHTGLSHFYANPEASSQLISEWEISLGSQDRKPLFWIRKMLQMDRHLRPAASGVLEMILTPNELGFSLASFCGICCIHDETDSYDSLVDESTMTLAKPALVAPEDMATAFNFRSQGNLQLRRAQVTPTNHYAIDYYSPWTVPTGGRFNPTPSLPSPNYVRNPPNWMHAPESRTHRESPIYPPPRSLSVPTSSAFKVPENTQSYSTWEAESHADQADSRFNLSSERARRPRRRISTNISGYETGLVNSIRNAEAYIQQTRGSENPLSDHVRKAAMPKSQVRSLKSLYNETSRSKSDDASIPVPDEAREIRLRVDASTPLNLTFNGDIKGRTLKIEPVENGMADVIIRRRQEGD